MPVSIYDIAAKANVSPSTVSRALQDHPRIGAKTKRRILDLAKELNYIPSTVARSLTANQTWTIGMVVPSVSDPFMGRVIEGVEQAALEAGFNVFLSTSQSDRQREMEVITTLHQRRIDGIIVLSSHLFGRASSYVGQINVPVVVINEQEPAVSMCTVGVDDVASARVAVEHLIGLGHRRIGYVGIANRPKSNYHRLNGYKAALKAAGIAVDERLQIIGDPNDDHAQSGEASLDSLIAAGATATFCYNDTIAIGMLAACYQRRLAVPYDLSVVGFDDIDVARYAIPPLTTMRQPRFELGQRAMQLLLKLLGGEPPRHETLASELVVRATTAPPRPVRGGPTR